MLTLNTILAQTSETTAKQISEMYKIITDQPEWAFKLMWLLPLFLAVAIIMIFLRQKKIAKNQVILAEMIRQLLEKK